VHVSTTPVAIFREMSYKEYITKVKNQCTIFLKKVGFKIYSFKNMLKYKIKIKLFS